MIVLLKIAMLLISINLVEPFYNDGFYYCCVLTALLFFTLSYDLFMSFMTFVNGEFKIDEPSENRRHLTQSELDRLCYDSYYNDIPSEHHRYMPQNNTIIISGGSSDAKCLNESELIDSINSKFKNRNKFEIISKVDAVKKETSMFKTLKSILIKKEEKVVVENKKEEKKNIAEINKNLDNIKKEREEQKTSTNKSYIILKNEVNMTKEKSDVYDEIIKIIKEKKYPTSKNCRILQALQHVNVLKSNVIIYTNERCLDMTDLVPKSEITTRIKEKFNMKVTFINMKTVNILDYYLKVGIS